METISDTIDTNGKRHVVARYTAGEKAEMEKRRAEAETARKAKEVR